MNNMPKEKIAIVAVSRDCFPMDLSVSRRKAVVAAYKEKYGMACMNALYVSKMKSI